MLPYFLRTGKNAKFPYFARCVARELIVPPARRRAQLGAADRKSVV